MNSPVLKVLLVSLVLLCPSLGCIPRQPIAEEFVDCLIQLNATALDKVGSELQRIDQNLYAVEEKLLKLEQVIAPALEWQEKEMVELLEEFDSGSYSTRLTQEGLANFTNDQFRLTALEVSVYAIGTPEQRFATVVRVMDSPTRAQSDWEAIESELIAKKSVLEQRRQAKLEAGQLSASTLLRVIDHVEDWEIRRINKNAYSISGSGLGMDKELTAGAWIYYRASREIIPADAESAALRKTLSGGYDLPTAPQANDTSHL